MLKNMLLVFAGGGIGSVARYLVSEWVKKMRSLSVVETSSFPLGTFIVNVSGCLLIGLLMGYFKQKELDDSAWKFLLTIGFCGGFTTFSAFSAENIQLLQSGNNLTAFTYILLSVVLGLTASCIGLIIMK